MEKLIMVVAGGIVCLGLGLGLGYLVFNKEEKKCSSKEKEEVIEKVVDETSPVVKVDGETLFTYYDLISGNSGTPLLDTILLKVDKYILEKEYEDKVEDAEEYAKERIESLKTYYGDELLSTLKQYTSYITIEGYEESLAISYLQNLVITDYAKTLIKDKEIKEYYENEFKNKMKISDIFISIDITDDMSDKEKEDTQEKAKKQANKIIKELKEAKDIENEFAKLAKEYSDDVSTKYEGGLLGYLSEDDSEGIVDEIITTALKLKEGEFSTKAIETTAGYHIILRGSTKDIKKLEDAEDIIKEILAKKYVKDNQGCTIKALNNMRKEHDFEILNKNVKNEYEIYVKETLEYWKEYNSVIRSKK